MPLWISAGITTFVMLVGAGVAGSVGTKIAGIAFFVLLLLMVLAFSVMFFNRPKVLVPSRFRDEPGALAERRRR
jgi:hypothetical protein